MGGHGALTCFFKNPGFYKVGRLPYNKLIIYFNVTFHILLPASKITDVSAMWQNCQDTLF